MKEIKETLTCISWVLSILVYKQIKRWKKPKYRFTMNTNQKSQV